MKNISYDKEDDVDEYSDMNDMDNIRFFSFGKIINNK